MIFLFPFIFAGFDRIFLRIGQSQIWTFQQNYIMSTTVVLAVTDTTEAERGSSNVTNNTEFRQTTGKHADGLVQERCNPLR